MNLDFFMEPRSVFINDKNSLGVRYVYSFEEEYDALNDMGKSLIINTNDIPRLVGLMLLTGLDYGYPGK
jgi:hypothetical protein